MKTVREILHNKGSNYWNINPDATVYEALQLMSEKDIGALLVIENEIVLGILSERDYARKVVLFGKSSKDALVKEIMSTKVIYVEPHVSPEECMALMTTKRVRHLPVIENKKVKGVVSIGDVVKAVIDEQEFVIDQLVHYITGAPKLLETTTDNE